MSKGKSVVSVIPDTWGHIVTKKKTLIGWPDWSDVAVLTSAPNTRSSRDDLHTVAAEETYAIFGLADENGIGLEGVRLRLKAWAYRRHSDVTATLEVIGSRSFVAISRIDAWPSDPHQNSFKALRRPALRSLPQVIEGCHVHRFTDNVKYGPEAFGPGPEGNLPVAVAFPSALQSFRDFLRSVGTEFNIEGLEDFSGPESWKVIL